MAETLEKIVGSFYLNKDNAVFSMNGDIPCLKVKKTEEGVENIVEYKKIILVRNFPFQYEREYITVLDEKAKEIGIIKSIADFGKDTEEILAKELNRRYYMPKISKILKMKEKMGFSNWTVVTDFGQITFSVKDTYKNIVKLHGGRCIITDVDGNRYEIPSLSGLDKTSYKRIELII